MAKIFTVTCYTKSFNHNWRNRPSFVGKIIMSDDMRFIGYTNEGYLGKGHDSYVHGTFIKDGDDMSLAFYKLDPETENNHVYVVKDFTKNAYCDGVWGSSHVDKHDQTSLSLSGELKIEIREYSFLDSVARSIMRKYEEISALKPHNKELMNHINIQTMT